MAETRIPRIDELAPYFDVLSTWGVWKRKDFYHVGLLQCISSKTFRHTHDPDAPPGRRLVTLKAARG